MVKTQKSDQHEIMVVNDTPGEECRIAILQDRHLQELYTERIATATNVGNIYKGRVTNVESAIQAAFVDFGQAKNGFLHISDLHPRYFSGPSKTEQVGKKIPRRSRPLIQNALRRGDEVLVQVLKEGIGTKGPTLTSYLSIPGRLIVMMPDMDRVGVSRKVEDEDKRREMRKVLDSLDLPEGFGFILRTAGVERTKTELKRDVAYLTRLWSVMDKRIKHAGTPCELYTESDLFVRTMRDVLRPSISTIIVDSQAAYERATMFLKVVAPRSAPKVLLYREPVPIFHAFDVERQIELIHSRFVPLPSGGQLVIDQTEALVAIDVNSGKSRSARDSETNAYQTNCEAVDEICRQIRLRDLGGLIINDLIDMRVPKNRRSVESRIRENLKNDRAKSTALNLSMFGILEMTRQRMRPSLRMSHFMDCPYCAGHGEVRSPDYVGMDATRQLGYLLHHKRVVRVELVCSPRVASVLLSNRRRELVRIEETTGKKIDVRVSESIATDRVNFYVYDDRNAAIDIEQLPTIAPPSLAEIEKKMSEPELATTQDPEKMSRSKSRRRRRKKAGPADASSIVTAAEIDVDREFQAALESKDTTKRSSRRKSGHKKPADNVAAKADTEKSQKPEPISAKSIPAAPPAKPARVHILAKELGTTSKDMLARCREAGGFEVKNHMSSITAEQAAVIRGWYTPIIDTAPETEAVIETDRESENSPKGPRRRRRGRRGGRRRRKHIEGGAEATQDRVHQNESQTESSESQPQPVTKKPRRSKKKVVVKAEPASTVTVSGSTDLPASTENDSPETQSRGANTTGNRRKRSSRRKKSKASTTSKQDQKDVLANGQEMIPEIVTVPDLKVEIAKPIKKKRKTLYGGRRVTVSQTAREEAEKTA